MATLTADKRMLLADLSGDVVRAAEGAMVAYTGTVDFKHAGMGGGGGFKAALKQKVAGSPSRSWSAQAPGGFTLPRTLTTWWWST